jgi:hypothetical protein
MIRRYAAAFVVLVFAGDVRAADREIVVERDDVLLWKAAAQDGFYHNDAVVRAETWLQHADLVSRLTSAPAGLRRTLLANTVMARDAIRYGYYLPLKDNSKKLQGGLPAAWNLTTVNIMLRSLVGSEPSMKEIMQGDIPGGLVEAMDKMRHNMAVQNIYRIYIDLLQASLADQVEAHYRELLGNRRLSDNLSLFFYKTTDEVGYPVPFPSGPRYTMGAMMVRVSYAGDRPLKDVVVVTRARMKPLNDADRASRQRIRTFNEFFGTDAARVKAADIYFWSMKILSVTPNAWVAYAPLLEPGDVLYVPLYDPSSYWHIDEAKVSLYSDCGAVLDKVMMRAGPWNDLSDKSVPPATDPKQVPALPNSPIFQRAWVTTRVELTLRPPDDVAAGLSFETCIPVDESFLALRPKVAVDAGKPLRAFARSRDAYVAQGPARTTGHGLILVPTTAVAKMNQIDERNDAQKEFHRDILRGNPLLNSPFFPPLPGRPTALGTAEKAKPTGNGRDNARANMLLRLGRTLESSGKHRAALEYYREITKEYSGSVPAKTAVERIKALTGK